MDEKTVKIMLDVGKLVLNGYFLLMQQAGQSQEEARALFDESEKIFLENDPAKLPDA